MSVNKSMQKVADNFNMKMLLERSLVQLERTENHRPSYQITIPEDKYIQTRVIYGTKELRSKIESHFLAGGADSIQWNNTGTTFSIFTNSKPI